MWILTLSARDGLLTRGKRDDSHHSRPGHPGWLRCFSLTDDQHARSLRLSIWATRSGTHASHHDSRGLAKRRALLVLCGVALVLNCRSAEVRAQVPSWLEQYRQPAARLIGEATGDTFAWRRLAVLTDSIGHRLSGTPQLDRAIAWAVAEMKRDGLENVHTEKVMVPHWIRGNESVEIVEPAHHPLVMLGLGNSVGTGPDGVQAEILIVHSFNELDGAALRVKGRIVLFNVAYTNYEETVTY